MRIDIITVLPEMLEGFVHESTNGAVWMTIPMAAAPVW